MKNYNIIYKNNKFYDTSTGNRVFPKDDGKFVLVGDNDAFANHDPLNKPHENVLDSREQIVKMKKIKTLRKYKKILPAGSELTFDFSITKKKHENEPPRYKFRLKLFEDLFLYSSVTLKNDSHIELQSCRCVVFQDLNGNVEYFEPIFANSLNEIFSKTRQFYFPNQGTPGESVYNVMRCDLSNGGWEYLEDLRKRHIADIENWVSV